MSGKAWKLKALHMSKDRMQYCLKTGLSEHWYEEHMDFGIPFLSLCSREPYLSFPATVRFWNPGHQTVQQAEASHQVSIDKYFLSISYEYRRK